MRNLIKMSPDLTTIFALLLNILSHYSEYTTGLSSSSSQSKQVLLGLEVEDFIKISSHLSQVQTSTSSRIRVTNLEIFWKYLNPQIADSIRQDCGIKYFIDALFLNTSHNEFKHRGVNCSFSKEHAAVTIRHEEHFKLAMHDGKLKVLSIHSFEGDDEICTLKLGGYEKFQRIFTTALWDKDKVMAIAKNVIREDFVLIEFPRAFQSLISKSIKDFAIFNPNEGKGTRFMHSKKCFETILSDKRTIEEIQNICHFECKDYQKDKTSSIDKMEL